MGDRQVRNAGTIGGSLCWNYVASCMPNVCLCLDATLVLASLAGGERTVPIDAFLVGPLETARRDDELLIEINFPASKPHGVGSAYRKYGATVDGLPIVGIAASVEVDEAGLCSDVRFSVGGILPTTQRCDDVRALLRGKARHARGLCRSRRRCGRCDRDADGPPRQRPLSQGADPYPRPRRSGRGPCPRHGDVGA